MLPRSLATARASARSGSALVGRTGTSLLGQRAATARLSSSIAPGATPTSSLISYGRLDNGVRVATEATPGHFSAVGVYIDAGSRFERPWVAGESGVSHLMDRMAFKATGNRTADEMQKDIEALGGNIMCSSSRETIMYQSSFFNQDLDKVLRILADTTINPVLSDEELDAQRAAAAWEIDEIWNKPEMIIPELLHSVAYANNTLGNPLLCPVESLEVMKSDNLRDYMRRFYTPPRIVVAGAGMQHELLMELSNRYFGGLEAQQPAAQLIGLSPSSSSPSSSSSSASSPRSSTASSRSASPSMFASSPASSTTSLSSSGPSFDYSTSAALAAQHASKNAIDVPAELQRARYTGGQLYQSRPELDFTHVYVAFEGLAITDPDIYALATLQILLGGGGSFSAGGPGKGMYSRLYSNVLNQFHAVDYCAAFHHCYADSGLFGIAASVQHDFAPQVAKMLARELELCTGPFVRGGVTHEELARAKNQLKSSLVMALESRLVEVEDLGRQVQVHGHKVTVEEMCDHIDKVDLAALHRVATRVLRPKDSRSTVVAMGDVSRLNDVRELLSSRGLGQ